ncbi:methyltransferase domain-containing protein [Agromyces sp. NPDC058110]|uniref:methyltransferase domain-containing protein n=1 Tax=Agromyces sp. NPDC058110 TaxID=3346345 RepID=UPI0036D90505
MHAIDLVFDGRRLWSTAVGAVHDGELHWPAALTPHLVGSTTLVVRDSADQRILATLEVAFDASRTRVDPRDAVGRPLAMNKWNRLGPVFEGGDSGLRDRLLQHAAKIVDIAETAGYTLYIVGGSLLGYRRSGGLMPHDDDIDFAFLSDHSDPGDIALDGYRLERVLREAGQAVVRHSLTHLEVDAFDEHGHVEHYVDIFTGYFRDGLYCQPFALRGPEVGRDDLVPVQRVEVDGVLLPAPARPDAWLEYAYGPDWPIPDPSFTFVTNQWTSRRFENSFGVFNRGRVFWEKKWLARDGAATPVDDPVELGRFLDSIPDGAHVLDLGCGSGAATNEIARAGHPVLGVDYSHEALAIAAAGAAPGARFAYLNLNDRHEALALGAQLLATGEIWFVRMADVLHGISRTNRHNVFHLLELVLRGGATAIGTVPTDLPRSYRHGDPTTWHYPDEWFVEEIAVHDLSLEFGDRRRLLTKDGPRDVRQFSIRSDRIDGRTVAGGTA